MSSFLGILRTALALAAVMWVASCGDGSSCPGYLTECNSVCVSLNANRYHCGACGNACEPGYVCNGAGSCELSCQEGLISCDDTCVDPATNPRYCGASGDCLGDNAGVRCPEGTPCNGAGQCAVGCAPGLVLCGGQCVDPMVDPSYCGASGDCEGDAAGEPCEAGVAVCDGSGTCAATCRDGLVNCGGLCIDPDNDNRFCGAWANCVDEAAGAVCGAGTICDGGGTCAPTCLPGLLDCDGTCIDPDNDRRYCGARGECIGADAGQACAAGQVCNGAGSCAPACREGFVSCAGACIDPRTDPDYCGASDDCVGGNAGAACADDLLCDGSGSCASECAAGWVACDGRCIDPRADGRYCGASDDCTGATAGTSCTPGLVCDGGGTCAGACRPGMVECGGRCVDPDSDRFYCGASGDCTGDGAGQLCDEDQVCDGAGACAPDCADGLVECDGRCIDPNTDASYCGAAADCTGDDAGTVCESGLVCDGAGACAARCSPGLVACGGVCVDPNTDRDFCGARWDCIGANAGASCGGDELCNGAGACAATCRQGLVECDGVCIDPSADRDHCGAVADCLGVNDGERCAAAELCNGEGLCEQACSAGFVDCDGVCIDPATDARYCGASADCQGATAGLECPSGSVCDGAGECAMTCRTGLLRCGDRCVDPSVDPDYCGASGSCTGAEAGEVCAPGLVCGGSGICEMTCDIGLVLCGDRCIDPDTDGAHCGAWGACESIQTGQTCSGGELCDGAGTCAPTCQPGLVACDGVCTNPDTDPRHCGASGACAAAGAGEICEEGTVCDGSGACESSCSRGLLECGGRCVDPKTDTLFCGARGDCTGSNRGTACPAGFMCVGDGTCGLFCQAGLIACGGQCIDPKTDNRYCGAHDSCMGPEAGITCPQGYLCGGTGVCVSRCQPGFLECDGRCVDPRSDRVYCGASGDCLDANSGAQCPDGTVCDGAGQCRATCQPGYVLCGGTCIDPATSRYFCGASGDCTGDDAGVACADGQVCNGFGACGLFCSSGLVACDGKCIDPLSDRAHCGASGDCLGSNAGVACPDGYVCGGTGACELSCQAGLVDCGGLCVNPMTDNTFCGATGDCVDGNAGTICDPGFVCDGTGVCQVSCQLGLLDCNGECIDPQSDVTYCGASDDCRGSNAGQTCAVGAACVDGTCTETGGGGGGGCTAPLSVCGTQCVDTNYNPSFCGDCGTVCGEDDACLGGSCVLFCGVGLTNCGDSCVDALTDSENCGGCERPCEGEEVCVEGRCIGPDCHTFGLIGWSCPSGVVEYCTSELDPLSETQAKEACEACYDSPCYLITNDCAGSAYGPRPQWAVTCGDGHFGFADGCSGDAGRIWRACTSGTTYGKWAPRF